MSQPAVLEAILADLAAGKIDTAEATRRIEALGGSHPGAAASTDPYDDPAPVRDEFSAGRPQYATHATERIDTDRVEPTGAAANPGDDARSTVRQARRAQTDDAQSSRPNSTVTRLIVRATGRFVRVVGDATVISAEVEGPHTLRRSGELLEVISESDVGPSLRGFSFFNPPRSGEDLRRLGFGQELVIRVNPQIEVDAELTGGGLTTVQVPRLGRIRVTAGAANLSDVITVRDALIQAGGASVSGPIAEGRNRVRVESGNLNVTLPGQANVTVVAHARLGMVNWPAGQPRQLDEYVVGNGAARLDLSVMMGHVSVREQPDAQPDDNPPNDQPQWWEIWRH